MRRCCFVAAVLMLVGGPRYVNAQTFTNSTPITINDNAAATPYPSTIVVSGLTAPIAKITVRLSGLVHPSPGDIDVLLVSPSGARLLLFSDVGGVNDFAGEQITIDDAAADLMSTTNLPTGTYRPTDSSSATDVFPAPVTPFTMEERAAPSGIGTLGSRFNGQSGNGTWSLYIRDDTGTDAGLISAWSLTITQATSSAPTGHLIISEFRLRGALGAQDEFIEIHNSSVASHTVWAISGTGYGIASSDGITRCTIPNGTVIPQQGHFLCTNAAYSLGSYPAGSGLTAAGDAAIAGDIPDNMGIALFNNNTGGASFYSLVNRLDAVGPASEANVLYKEGTGYPALTPLSIDYSLTRRPGGGCTGSQSGNCPTVGHVQAVGPVYKAGLVDFNNNATDFILVDIAGTLNGGQQRLGAPGPQNLSSPISLFTTGALALKTGKLDPCRPLMNTPNVVRDLAPDPPNNSAAGTLDIRRAITNATGGLITRMRFRIVDLTTLPALPGVADLRPRTSSAVTEFVRPLPATPGPCTGAPAAVTVEGTTLEQPPSQPGGGGYNSTLSVTSVTSATPLGPGGVVRVRFLLGLQAVGVVRFCIVPEIFPAAPVSPFCYVGNAETGAIATTDFDGDRKSDMTLYNPQSAQWKILRSGSGYTAESTVWWGGAGYLPVPGDYDGDGHVDMAVYHQSTGAWYVMLSSRNYASTFSVTYGGPGWLPQPGDYDGDGITDISVSSPVAQSWNFLASMSNFTMPRVLPWAATGYTPVPGHDFDGDGVHDLVSYRESTAQWSILQSSTNFATFTNVFWGGPGYTLVPGDYNGDGKMDCGVYNRRTGDWNLLLSPAYSSTQTVTQGRPGFLPMPGDYDGDRRTDIAYYRPFTAQWHALTSSSGYVAAVSATYGTEQEVPLSAAIVPATTREMIAGDVDGDHIADVNVYNSTTGGWHTLTSSSNFNDAINGTWGSGGSYTPAPGDYDGDGKRDRSVYQQSAGFWYVLRSDANFTTSYSFAIGGPGYIPLPGDYDGDGRTDMVVYNTSTGLWYGRKSGGDFLTTLSVTWGGPAFTPAPGDYDGDGRIDLGVWAAATGTWSILRSSSNYTTTISRVFGDITYAPVPADFDGDGITDIAVYRPSTGVWTWLKSSTENNLGYTITHGPGLTPVPGDWDADGRADVAVYNQAAGSFSILLSTGRFTSSLTRPWGGAAYVASPAFP